MSSDKETFNNKLLKQLYQKSLTEIKRLELQLEIERLKIVRTERSLQYQVDLFDKCFQSFLSPTAIMDQGFNFIKVNKAYANLVGKEVADFPGHNHFEFYPSDTREIFEHVVKTKKPYSVLNRVFSYMYDPDKGMTFWDGDLVPVLDRENEVEFLILTLNDVTERVRIAKELEYFFDLSLDGFVMLGFDGEIIRMNHSFRNIFELKQEGQANSFWARIENKIHGEDREETKKMKTDLQKGVSVRHFENRILLNGVCKWLSWEALSCKEREIIFLVVRDITQQKKLEKELARLDRLNLIGEMASSIAHEIRNPLSVVRGFLELMKEKEILSGDTEGIDLMIDELDRANSIISEFLSLAKDKPIDLKIASLNNILQNVCPLIMADAIKSDKEIILDLGNIPDIPLDEKEIRQLILNLVRNGLEAMSPGGTLFLKSYFSGQEVVLEVEDSGSGIPQEVLDRFGQPFVTTKENGTGLGVSVCYKICERHQAKMGFQTSPEGTTVSVKFAVENKTKKG
ncbi:ATP-binding protein [Candidatus Formimonas warabiya]|uniref:histidine kinase n=1 Tax=Formimonas warabiya TaxID=1761012 RepID=A0A3G1KVI6_FORW1|nr:ATP-binding protein [Candidatus Formimonas warabiya]ATW26417.1 hypothetical protein DCMF_18130 [Candidatus Formimonas warabiya]